VIQRISRKIEKEKSKSSKSRRSQRVGSRKILNKRKVRKIVKYLVQWKGFTVEHDSWEKKEDLENAKEVVVEFEERRNTEVRRQKKLDVVEEKNFTREELLGKYMAKILYGWNNGKFENEYLKKLERN